MDKEGEGYRLADFIYRLEQEGMGLLDMQSDEALELINECLPKNMLIARTPQANQRKGEVRMERTCRNCVHCLVETKECYEGGYTEIGDLDQVRSEEDCNAWKLRERKE